MRLSPALIALPLAALLSGCANKGFFGVNNDAPDEFSVARNAPLVVPPDFALTPPRPGDPDPGVTDPRNQALQALFGGPSERSAVERDILQQAEVNRATLGARSVAGDPETNVVNRGALVQTVLQLPAGPGREASVSVPQ